jgi:hypothetical protein
MQNKKGDQFSRVGWRTNGQYPSFKSFVFVFSLYFVRGFGFLVKMLFINYNSDWVKLHLDSGRIRYCFILTVLYFGQHLALFTFSVHGSLLESWIWKIDWLLSTFLQTCMYLLIFYFNKFIINFIFVFIEVLYIIKKSTLGWNRTKKDYNYTLTHVVVC